MEPDTMLLQTLCVITVLFIVQSSGSIQWPAGTYGIPKPLAGCPRADGFRWQTGWRLQDTNYFDDHYKSNNSRSPQFHIDGKVNKITVNRSFCMKGDTSDDKDRPEWPRGKYCIYENHNCPKGLTPGWVFWNDDETEYNLNGHGGFLPEGVYGKFTEIYFCCRTDGDKDDPILLPSKSPFFLLAYDSAKCQMVKWAVPSLEWIYYSTTDRNNDDQRNGSYPYNAGKMHPTIYYCYYQGCNKTLTAVSGTLKSPKYPKHYPNGQCCSWKIIVNTTQQIRLVFKSFSLQNERFTDELRVYDGEDETGEVLGVFYGGHLPPKEGIYSSSSRMFLIFKSDKTHPYYGFSASYFVGNNTVHGVTTSTEKSTPAAPITSPHFLTSKTSKVTPSSTVTIGTETSKVTSSPIVPTTTAKILKVTSLSSQQAWEMASSSYVISMTLQTPEVTHLSPITPTTRTHAMIKTTPTGKPWTSTTKLSPKIGCNETLTAVNGTFQSPNYPGKYPDGQYCFWRITVITAQQIYLIFSSFSLQKENNTDALYVYDKDNATGEALEVLYGGNPPPKKGICISSNQIFLVFKSEGSYHGFSASYYGANNSESCAIAASQPSEESGKRDERKQPQRKGLNVIAVVVPVVSAILVAGICYLRKRRQRVEGPEDEISLRKRRKRVEGPEDKILLRKKRKTVEAPDNEILLRLISEPSASVEDAEFMTSTLRWEKEVWSADCNFAN